MTIHTTMSTLPDSALRWPRTARSVAFEAFWRALPKTGLVPDRSVFLPERAPLFLRDLVLAEARLGGTPSVHMRLLGSAFEARIQRNLKGQSFLAFLPEARHAGAIEAVRQMIERPCGLWQVTPLHYERGFAQYIEFTIFPLRPGPDGLHMLLALTQPMNGTLTAEATGEKAIAVATAVTREFIDLGAGVPQ